MVSSVLLLLNPSTDILYYHPLNVLIFTNLHCVWARFLRFCLCTSSRCLVLLSKWSPTKQQFSTFFLQWQVTVTRRTIVFVPLFWVTGLLGLSASVCLGRVCLQRSPALSTSPVSLRARPGSPDSLSPLIQGLELISWTLCLRQLVIHTPPSGFRSRVLGLIKFTSYILGYRACAKLIIK